MKKLITKIRRLNVLVRTPVSHLNNFELITVFQIPVFVHVLVCIFGRYSHHPFTPARRTAANGSNVEVQSATDEIVGQMVRSFEIYPVSLEPVSHAVYSTE